MLIPGGNYQAMTNSSPQSFGCFSGSQMASGAFAPGVTECWSVISATTNAKHERWDESDVSINHAAIPGS